MVGTASFLRMLTCKKVLPCSKLLVWSMLMLVKLYLQVVQQSQTI
jgi:hypothetical protein